MQDRKGSDKFYLFNLMVRVTPRSIKIDTSPTNRYLKYKVRHKGGNEYNVYMYVCELEEGMNLFCS